jgi:hypothetical protein
MKKTFGSAFALIMVALFTVAPTSPATATATAGIHLHMAGKVGQKAAGTTIIFGAVRLSDVTPSQQYAPNGCLVLTTTNDASELYWMEPLRTIPAGWDNQCKWSDTSAQLAVDVPAGGNFAGSAPLPGLPAGLYQLEWGVLQTTGSGSYTKINLTWKFTIGADGTFTAIGEDWSPR